MIVTCSFTGEKLYQWMKVLVDANIKQTFPFFNEANKIFSLKLDPTPKMRGRGRIVFPSSIGENIPKWEVLQSVLLKDHFYDRYRKFNREIIGSIPNFNPKNAEFACLVQLQFEKAKQVDLNFINRKEMELAIECVLENNKTNKISKLCEMFDEQNSVSYRLFAYDELRTKHHSVSIFTGNELLEFMLEHVFQRPWTSNLLHKVKAMDFNLCVGSFRAKDGSRNIQVSINDEFESNWQILDVLNQKVADKFCKLLDHQFTELTRDEMKAFALIILNIAKGKERAQFLCELTRLVLEAYEPEDVELLINHLTARVYSKTAEDLDQEILQR